MVILQSSPKMGSSESKPEDPACQLAKKYALEDLKITRETDESIEEAFREIERISKKIKVDFGAFKKECSKYQIDDLYVNEVRDTHDNQVIF